MGGLHESRFVDAELFHEAADVRQRGLPHADDADVLAFDERDVGKVGQQFRDARRRHPARRATTEDNDADFSAACGHFFAHTDRA